MTADGAASVDASQDFDRCLELAEADPSGDDMFSTLISLWAYYLSRAELDRAREVSASSATRSMAGATSSGPRTSPASGCSTGSAAASQAQSRRARPCHRRSRPRWRAPVAAAWFVPNDPARGDVRASRARQVHGGRRRREPRRAWPRRARRPRRSGSRRDRGACPMRAGSARGCGSRRARSTGPRRGRRRPLLVSADLTGSLLGGHRARRRGPRWRRSPRSASE